MSGWCLALGKYREFEIQMRDFGHSVGLICALEQGGHVDGEEAYRRIKDAWKKLRAKRKEAQGEPTDS